MSEHKLGPYESNGTSELVFFDSVWMKIFSGRALASIEFWVTFFNWEPPAFLTPAIYEPYHYVPIIKSVLTSVDRASQVFHKAMATTRMGIKTVVGHYFDKRVAVAHPTSHYPSPSLRPTCDINETIRWEWLPWRHRTDSNTVFHCRGLLLKYSPVIRGSAPVALQYT